MRRALFAVALLATSTLAIPAEAHYCSNIWTGPSRLLIKPEQASVTVAAGATATLKVFFQNNFPYKIFNVKMMGTASGYTITVAPAQQNVGPGQQVLFTYSIKGTAGTVQASAMNLKVNFRVGTYGASNIEANPSPTQSAVMDRVENSGEQAPALAAATLMDKFPSATLPAGEPYFGRTGAQQLINWFGYRFCYDTGGSWRCGTQNCPSPCAEGATWTSTDVFPQDCMRAGVDLGAYKAKLGANLDPARAAATNAVSKGGGIEHRCLAAVVGGLLWQGGASTAFETALNALPSPICKAAGLRALGKGTASTCASGAYHEKAACAAAEALAGNDSLVASILVANAGDGASSSVWQSSLYYAYMLYLVTMDRYGKGQQPPWYSAVGPGPEASVPKKDSGGPKADLPPPKYNEAGQVIPEPEAGAPGADGAGPGPGPGAEGGCGCAVDASAPPIGAALLMVIPVLLLARRRRRG